MYLLIVKAIRILIFFPTDASEHGHLHPKNYIKHIFLLSMALKFSECLLRRIMRDRKSTNIKDISFLDLLQERFTGFVIKCLFKIK